MPDKSVDLNYGYTEMSGAQIVDYCKDDASLWAAAFREHAIKLGYGDMDEGWLTGWFANAIEGAHDHRWRRAQPPTQPHKSKFPT